MGAAVSGRAARQLSGAGRRQKEERGARAADSGEQGNGLVGTQVKRPCLKTVGDDGQLTGAAREIVAAVVKSSGTGTSASWSLKLHRTSRRLPSCSRM